MLNLVIYTCVINAKLKGVNVQKYCIRLITNIMPSVFIGCIGVT
jgi:hypothetical protein